MEEQCREIRSWQAEIVPGLMQSWSYTLAVIEREPDEAWAQARRARLALLDDQDRTVMQLLPEGVLRMVIGSKAVMREQLEHLIELSRRPNVRLGVLPHGRPVPPLPPSFHLYGDRMATNETIVGTAFLDERVDIDRHRHWFDRLDQAAIYDSDARAVLHDIRAAHKD
ncbi:putative DNA-binding protein [Pseudonocardia sp. N23]|nr:putative DNA-binding protein [Pseudonocardia sp. N23]